MLCGLPHTEINQRILEDLPKIAEKVFGVSHVYVINPEEQTIIHEIKNYRFGQVIRLPKITCLALIDSFEIGNHESQSLLDTLNDENRILQFYEIALIWFQDEFAFPIANSVLEKLSNMSWKNVARNAGYSISEDVNIEEEKEKIQKEIIRLQGFLKGVEKKLSNEKFINNAPEQVVAIEKKKKSDAKARIKILEEYLASL